MKNKTLIIIFLLLALGVVAWSVSRNQKTNKDIIPTPFEGTRPQNNTAVKNEMSDTPLSDNPIKSDTAKWKTYKNKEVGISFQYPDVFERVNIKVNKGDTGRIFTGVLEFFPNHWISFDGITKDFREPKGGSIFGTFGYEKNDNKYFLKFLWGDEAVTPSEFWTVNDGKDQALVVRNTEIGQILSTADVSVFVNIPNSQFPGIVFLLGPSTPTEPIHKEELDILHKIVSSIKFET